MTFLGPLRQDDPRPYYEQIMAEIRKAIVRGALQPDDPLPSTRQLAIDLGVNPNTVQQAYRELEREGTTIARRGREHVVARAAGGERTREKALRSIALAAIRDAASLGVDADALVRMIEHLDGVLVTGRRR